MTIDQDSLPLSPFRQQTADCALQPFNATLYLIRNKYAMIFPAEIQAFFAAFLRKIAYHFREKLLL
jgi:hypothetical protein